MKQIVLCVLVSFFSMAAFAQKGIGAEVAFGLDFGVPVGHFTYSANPGYGADVKVGYNFTQHWAALAEAGYMAFITTQKLSDRNINSIGDGFIKFGSRYTTNGRLYVEPAIGVSKFNTATTSDIGGNGVTLAAAVGYYADAAKTLDFSVRYESTSNSEAIHFVGVRLGYRLVSGHSF